MKSKYFLFTIIFLIILILIKKRKEVTYEEGEKLKENNRFDIFMETSAKSGFNILKLFCDAAKILYEQSLENNVVNKVR